MPKSKHEQGAAEAAIRRRGAGFRVQGSGFRVQGSGFRVQGSGFRVRGSGFRVQGSGFREEGSGSAWRRCADALADIRRPVRQRHALRLARGT